MRILQLQSQDLSADDPRLLAHRELLEGTNPTVVRRKLPDGSHEDRYVRDLKLSAVLRRQLEQSLQSAS